MRMMSLPRFVLLSLSCCGVVTECEGSSTQLPTKSDTVPFQEVFADGARICFLGDSITKQAQWCKVIADYFYTRFPDRHFSFINAGIAGDTARGSLVRIDEDVIPSAPNVVTVMFGMNDLGMGNYVSNPSPSQIDARRDSFVRYERDLAEVFDVLTAKLPDVKTCWFTPTPYDESAMVDVSPHLGYGVAVENGAKIMRRHAVAKGARLVEVYDPMSKFNSEQRLADPSFTTLCGPDRVHPKSEGGFFMAYTILKSWGAPSCVSDVVIDARTSKCISSEDANAHSVIATDDKVSFICQEKALPFPVAENLRKIATLIKFDDTLNRELLSVKGLAEGEWGLLIDGISVTNASASAWCKGVNLSILPTPQARQARKVAALNARRVGLETKLRTLAGERHFLRKIVKNIDDWDEVQQVVKSFEGKKGYFVELLPTYLAEWPSRGKLIDEIHVAEEEIYKANQPVPHRYVLVKTGN